MSQQEVVTPKDRPTLLLESIIGDKKSLHTLLSQSEAREEILDKASIEIGALDAVETGNLARQILLGLSREDAQWDQDKRDGALEILQLIDLGKIRRDWLARDYLVAVNTQNGRSDPYGTISGLLEAGKVVGPYLGVGEATKTSIELSWDNVARQFSGEDQTYILQGKKEVVDIIPLHAEDLIGHPDMKLGWREHPTFEPQEQALHDLYIDTTRKQQTFKVALWENVPDFRALCQTHGIALEAFWNINDPDEVAQQLEDVRLAENTLIGGHFEQAVRETTGLALSDLAVKQTRFLADEVVQAARQTQEEIRGTIGDFSAVIDKFRLLIREARSKQAKAQKVLGRQVNNFFRENGVSLPIATINELEVTLDDQVLLAQVETEFNKKQQEKSEAIQTLNEIFQLGNKPVDYSLISRKREDLFLGDLTGDCTAYHLNTGMNAWTVPGWVTNPGFNFYKITNGEHLVAKLGIILAIANDQTVLVIDSFEVGQDRPDDSTTITQVRGGLRFLGEWATRVGLSGVYVNTISNSSGAVDLLKDCVKRGSWISKAHALGGLSGIAELRRRLIGNQVGERIYLQSADSDFDDDEGFEQSEFMQAFEEMINETMKKASTQNSQTIETLARNQDWPGLFRYIMSTKFPQIQKLFGDDWPRYQKLMNELVVNELGQAHSKAYSREGTDTFRGPVFTAVDNSISEDTSEAWAMYLDKGQEIPENVKEVIAEDEKLWQEASLLDELLVLLKEMEFKNISPELALKQLYGRTESDEKGLEAIHINPGLPRLAT